MRISSIDIGTNTILLLIAETDATSIVRVLHDEQVIARLGKGVDHNRIINQETFKRAADFLRSYGDTSARFGAERIFAVGTSALRDASNKQEFCDFIRRTAGISIEILSGEEEAEWTCRGAVVGIDTGDGSFTVLDIGGGSTEIVSAVGGRILNSISLDIGCVRITERLLRASPPTDQEIASSRDFIRRQIQEVDFVRGGITNAVGVAGTVTTLAAMRLQLAKYDPARVHGYELGYDDIQRSFDLLKGKTLDEIKSIPQITSGRADILLAGVMILLEFLDAAGIKKITVSDRGLRYGVLLREIERTNASY